MNAEAGGRDPILALEDAAKSYGAVHALKHGTIALRPGEVRALVGENGAGKSTLVKLLGGVTRLDEGRMLVAGEPVDFHSPTDARDAGNGVVYQEPTLFPDLSVAENVVMGGHPLGALRRIDRREMHDSVQAQLDRLGDAAHRSRRGRRQGPGAARRGRGGARPRRRRGGRGRRGRGRRRVARAPLPRPATRAAKADLRRRPGDPPARQGVIEGLRDSVAPFISFFNGPIWARNGEPGVANFAVGNPQEMPLPGYVEALRDRLEPQSTRTGSPTS